jgi:hypothetical protein
VGLPVGEELPARGQAREREREEKMAWVGEKKWGEEKGKRKKKKKKGEGG